MKQKLLSIALIGLCSTLSHAAQTMYAADFSQMTIGYDSERGSGTSTVPYYLVSGPDLNAGAPLLVTYTLSTNFLGQEYGFSTTVNVMSNATGDPGSSVPGEAIQSSGFFLRVGMEPDAAIGLTKTGINLSVVAQAIAGYQLVDQNIDFRSFYNDQLLPVSQPPFGAPVSDPPLYFWDVLGKDVDHNGGVTRLEWEKSLAGGTAGSEGEYMAFVNEGWSTGNHTTFLIYDVVPEPTSAALFIVTGSLFFLRRKR